MESLTQAWLRQNVQFYASRDRVFADVDSALARFPALRPKSDVYTFDDGRTQLLLCVHGLLPIVYRTVSYNIPVNVWLTRDYPRQPPIAYVVPTNDMLVRPGRLIDPSGRCSHDYLQHWERKDEVRVCSAPRSPVSDSHFPPQGLQSRRSVRDPPGSLLQGATCLCETAPDRPVFSQTLCRPKASACACSSGICPRRISP
ncbi:hypothetical protein MD484_g4373, partial [Candolleomyces efflorescens]